MGEPGVVGERARQRVAQRLRVAGNGAADLAGGAGDMRWESWRGN